MKGIYWWTLTFKKSVIYQIKVNYTSYNYTPCNSTWTCLLCMTVACFHENFPSQRIWPHCDSHNRNSTDRYSEKRITGCFTRPHSMCIPHNENGVRNGAIIILLRTPLRNGIVHTVGQGITNWNVNLHTASL